MKPAISHVLVNDDVIASEFKTILNLQSILGDMLPAASGELQTESGLTLETEAGDPLETE